MEEEEAKLHERRLKEPSNIQGLEVHGKSKEKEYKMMIKEMCLVELSLRALNKQENDGTIAAADNCIRDLTEVVKSMAHMQKIQHIAVEEGASTARGFQEGKFSFSLTENDAKEEKKKKKKKKKCEREEADWSESFRGRGGANRCYNCDEVGHFSRDCPRNGSSKSKVGKRKKKVVRVVRIVVVG